MADTVRTQSQISSKDKEIIRGLAMRVAELAARPVEEEKRNLWYKHNALEPTRPLIFCDPENGWNEIITQDMLECESNSARGMEWYFRREIFWGEQMCDDRVIEPVYRISHAHTETGWGLVESYTGGQNGGSYIWDPPLKSYNDMDKLICPKIEVDYEATQRTFEQVQDLIGDILEVRLQTAWWWSLGMTWPLVRLRGLEQVMYDMLDCPDDLHCLMKFLRYAHLARLDFLEENLLLSLNNRGEYVGSGGFGWTNELPQDDFDGRVRTCDMWGFAESQETVGVSPDMFEEFIFPYQLTILERFGLNCYACCEPVDLRWHVIERIPRLRRVSVSPWSNLRDTAEKLGNNYIFSMKPNPAYLAAPTFDEERIRTGLREAFEITRNCRVEAIMKDNHTICNDSSRVVRWVKIAREESERLGE